MTPAQIVDRVLSVYSERGHRHYGEQVTENQHALQCAAFASQFNESPSVIAACLLHDYGHLAHEFGEDIAIHGHDAHHEDLGADLLAPYFTADVVEPIRLHVAAKRYLCAVNRAYFDGLSAASRRSLMLQGGPMSDDEVREFERHPHFESAVRLRKYDDMGKVTDMQTPGFGEYRHVLESFVTI